MMTGVLGVFCFSFFLFLLFLTFEFFANSWSLRALGSGSHLVEGCSVLLLSLSISLIALVCVVSSLTFRKGSARDAPRLFRKKYENIGCQGGGKERPLAHPLKQYERSPYEREILKASLQETRPLVGMHIAAQEGLKVLFIFSAYAFTC